MRETSVPSVELHKQSMCDVEHAVIVLPFPVVGFSIEFPESPTSRRMIGG
jgi:hypothetical protein